MNDVNADSPLVGKSILIGYHTVELDGHGQSGTLVEHLAEIIYVDAAKTVFAVTPNGDHHFIPIENVFEAQSAYYVAEPDLIAVHEITKDRDRQMIEGVQTRWLNLSDATTVLEPDQKPL